MITCFTRAFASSALSGSKGSGSFFGSLLRSTEASTRIVGSFLGTRENEGTTVDSKVMRNLISVAPRGAVLENLGPRTTTGAIKRELHMMTFLECARKAEHVSNLLNRKRLRSNEIRKELWAAYLGLNERISHLSETMAIRDYVDQYREISDYSEANNKIYEAPVSRLILKLQERLMDLTVAESLTFEVLHSILCARHGILPSLSIEQCKPLSVAFLRILKNCGMRSLSVENYRRLVEVHLALDELCKDRNGNYSPFPEQMEAGDMLVSNLRSEMMQGITFVSDSEAA